MSLILGTCIPNREAYECARHREDLLLGSWENTVKIGQYQAPLLLPEAIKGWARWIGSIQRHPPAYAVTPPMLTLEGWNDARKTIEEAHYLCGKEVIVWAESTEVAQAAKQENYTLGVSAHVDGWSDVPPWHLSPGRVWVLFGDPLTQWRRFCELAWVGCDIQGVIFDDTWFYQTKSGKMLGKTPYQVQRYRVRQQKKRRERIGSLDNLMTFWQAVNRVYATQTN